MATTDTTNQIFAANVKHARLSLGLSQESLAEIAGLHRTYISALERGERNVSLKNVGRIATALALTPSELLDETGFHHA